MIMAEEKKIIAYKAFNKDLQCRDFQYEVGKEYQTDEKIKCCRRGFHAFESPLEVWCYRGILNARFAKVELSGTIDRRWNGFTKICSSHIKIKEELKLADIIKLGVKWLENATSPSETETDSTLNDKGDTSVRIASNDDYVRIGSSGNDVQIESSGIYAYIGSSGSNARIASSGPYARIGVSGYDARIGSSGGNAVIGSSGLATTIASSGCADYIGLSGGSSYVASSGSFVQIGSSGDKDQIGSSGGFAKIMSSGESVQIGSSGDNAEIRSSGDSAQIGSSGNDAKISSTGEDAVIMCAGLNSKAKAKKRSWITLSEWRWDSGKRRFAPVCVRTEYVDGERIKADTWYQLINGKFKEVQP